jgi:hypothetical protein
VFEQGEWQDVVCRIDDRATGKDKTHSLQLFRDAGWEHLMEHLGCECVRQADPGGASPDICRDNESKVQRYERVRVASRSAGLGSRPSFHAPHRKPWQKRHRRVACAATMSGMLERPTPAERAGPAMWS